MCTCTTCDSKTCVPVRLCVQYLDLSGAHCAARHRRIISSIIATRHRDYVVRATAACRRLVVRSVSSHRALCVHHHHEYNKAQICNPCVCVHCAIECALNTDAHASRKFVTAAIIFTPSQVAARSTGVISTYTPGHLIHKHDTLP